ncbi:MAG TPA: hypothetical protein VH518_01190 [Tepidisphaeraceae bacterium]|jgi:hypothetical protein
MKCHTLLSRSSSLVLIGLLAGCAGRASILPNPDPDLRKNSSQLAADAAKRQPYKADAPRGGQASGRAQVGYWADRLEVANLSDGDWNDVEVWVNQKYVCHVPKIEKGKLVVLFFQMIFDDAGNSFPTDNSKTRVDLVELYKDGKMYDMKTQLAD